MEEPSPRSSRLILAAASAAAILVGGAGFLLGRVTVPPQSRVPPPPAPVVEPAEPQPAPVRGLLGRAEVIALASAAADAAAAGQAPPPALGDADGRRFALRLPFGCAGADPPGEKPAMGWRYDPEAEVLRIHVDPVSWTAADWGAGDQVPVEAIEGFWIAHPWTSAEACPTQAGAPGGDRASAERTLALGQIFFADSGRGGRRDGEGYQATVRVAPSALETSKGFQFRMSGRISGARGLGPVRCRQPGGADQRPVCLVSVVLDELAIENPATGAVLATWNAGGSDAPGG